MFNYELWLDGKLMFAQSLCNFEVFRRRLDWLRIVESRMHSPCVSYSELGFPQYNGFIHFDEVKSFEAKAA